MSTFDTATVLGVGLLGGSLGLALRKHRIAETIFAWSPSASTREACESASWCDDVFDNPKSACEASDLIFLCGPVDQIPPLMEEVSSACKKTCLITDVGSTKKRICEAGNKIFPPGTGPTFIGSHPMAGSEKSGLRFASADLFQGKTCILTPGEAHLDAAETIGSLWKQVGMNLFQCSPEEHDQLVAHMSHLPHAIAASLSKTLQSSPRKWLESAGEGLKDTTRIAAGDPQLWSAIFLENREAVLGAISSASTVLNEFRDALEHSDRDSLVEFLKHGRSFRKLLEGIEKTDE
ncbi:MAG: prephenate dehydrogenase/arogenate dehydrogenase family protein [Verrucomicrobiota bacterium]